MDIAIGFRAHSGWAAAVLVAEDEGRFVVVDRQRVDFVTEEWAKQPYHAAEYLEAKAARALVKRGITAAHQGALRELRRLLKQQDAKGNSVRACGVLVGEPMPDWSVDEILAVHFRMHKAEGVLNKDALLVAAEECGIRSLPIPEKQLADYAKAQLRVTTKEIEKLLASIGKTAGPPWAKDQKDAALAAIISLKSPVGSM